ncbi:MAG: sigma-70 family RNA polymerase sigma factor [Myxococcales bacterium FL481]|nr:MAG: sigma-70 family RNA polymerase sigma factor [Myxococcales bacterium FL481]
MDDAPDDGRSLAGESAVTVRTRRLAPTVAGSGASIAERVDALYLKHHERVYATALHFGGGNHAWAEDVTQDVFFTLLDKLPSLPERGDLGPWLRRVTVNRCISANRRRRIRESPYTRWLLRPMPPVFEPEADLDVSEQLRRVWEALDELPPKQRAVFSLRHLEGESQTSIARILGHSDGYVSKLLRRAELRIRQAIDPGEDRDE